MLKEVATSVDRYAQFTIFDDVSASVKDGVVTLTGKVTMPFKRDDIAKRVAKIDGVTAVRDSKNPTGPALVFAPAAFGAFIDTVKAGQFDLRV